MELKQVIFNSEEFVQMIIDRNGVCPNINSDVQIIDDLSGTGRYSCKRCITKNDNPEDPATCHKSSALKAAKNYMNIMKNIKLVESL